MYSGVSGRARTRTLNYARLCSSHPHPCDADVEFFGDNLRQRRQHPLTQFNFARTHFGQCRSAGCAASRRAWG